MLIGFQAPAVPPKDTLTTILQLVSILGGITAISIVIFTRFWPWVRAKRDSRSLQKQLGPAFPKLQIKSAVSNYIQPDCQDFDPAEGEEPGFIFAVRQKLFDALDTALHHPTDYRYIILLADSGMGKTAAAINYCARHLGKLRKRFQVAIIPLGIQDADERIQAIEAKDKTVLFLDALDEDILANVDYEERLSLLLKLTEGFYRVVLTCRTQFFSKEEEIPRRTGVLKLSARSAGEPAEYYFNKIYLSPFSDEQIEKYIRRRYAPWFWKKRQEAEELVEKMPHLSVRPMLLSHIDDVIRSGKSVSYSHDLYEVMISAWIKREEGFIPDGNVLLNFSERLAIDLYLNRDKRGGERAPREEVQLLASNWGIKLDGWYPTSRSLLNRDGEGNFKFAHRSIMEYLIAKEIVSGKDLMQWKEVKWTDQTCVFIAEMVKESSSVAIFVHNFGWSRLEELIQAWPGFVNRMTVEEMARLLFDKEHKVYGFTETEHEEAGQSVIVPIYSILNGSLKRGVPGHSKGHPRGREIILISQLQGGIDINHAQTLPLGSTDQVRFFHNLVLRYLGASP